MSRATPRESRREHGRPGRHASVCLALLGVALGCTSPPPESQSHLVKGIEARTAGDLQTALDEFTRAVSVAGEDSVFYSRAILERAECHLALASAAGTPKDARIDFLAKALADFQAVAAWERPAVMERVIALDGTGRAHLMRGEKPGALRAFDALLAIPPEDADGELEEMLAFHLGAHRQAGWIHLEESYVHLDPADLSAADGAAISIRKAEEHFLRGLDIDPGDPECNLGVGISLHLRGQSSVALPHLEQALKLRPPEPEDPRRHYFFLASALERARGYQRKAIEHYTEALDHNPQCDFLPLYLRVARVLPVYVSVTDGTFKNYLRRLIEYRGHEAVYWEALGTLASQVLAAGGRDPELLDLGRLASALGASRKREPDIDKALGELLQLGQRPDFLQLLDRVFPEDVTAWTAMALGRAEVLYRVGSHASLEEWFQRGNRPELPERAASDPMAHCALIVRGLNLVSLAREQRQAAGDDEAPATRGDPILLHQARKILEERLAVAEDGRARLGLASALEDLGECDVALRSYEILARGSPAEDEAFERILGLLEGSKLSPAARARALEILATYAGQTGSILSWRDRDLPENRARTCASCGGRLAGAVERCAECGRHADRQGP